MDNSLYSAIYGYGPKTNSVSNFWKEKYEKEADRFWNKFYKSNSNKFFKDRHWLTREFEELSKEKTVVSQFLDVRKEQCNEAIKVLDIGCGVGNSLFPLLESNPRLYIFALDFSPLAIDLIKKNELFDKTRCLPLVCDITKSIPEMIHESSIDYILMIFMLSAVSPEVMPAVLTASFKVLQPGGKILFRDYAVNDMAQIRFEKEENNKEANKLANNFYVRGDGTRAYYFSLEFITEMFTKVGFVVETAKYITKEQSNRKDGIVMHRIWLQAKFLKPMNKSSELFN